MKEYITFGIIILGIFIEITPIKLNPISWIGKLFTKPILSKLEKLEKKVDFNDIDAVRNRIIANEQLLNNGAKFEIHQWESLYKDINKWNMYHEKYPDLNGIIKVAIENINRYYKNR